MKIHSSSLAFIPSGHKAANRNDQSQSLNSSKENSTETSSLSSSLPVNAVYEKTNLPKVQLISDDIEQLQKTPPNSRTAYAVNAYIQENSQTLKNQRSELISGIDVFA